MKHRNAPFLLSFLLFVFLCACGAPQEAQENASAPSPTQEEAFSSDEKEPNHETLSNDLPEETDLPAAPPAREDFVCVTEYLPDLFVDLKYATEDNFTGTVIYDFQNAYLRYGTVQKLAAVAESVGADGYRLLIWDAFRPVSAQFKLWKICPDPVYVSNPNNGFSSHSRGNTVDITLVYQDGSPVEMPTGFDDFSTLADRDYSDVPESAAANARYLENLMIANGFKAYSGEWWHFSDIEVYDVEESFVPPA